MLSILTWKEPSDIPGGRINTMSWQLVCCNFLGTNGHDERHMWPLCCVCPMRRVEYRTIGPLLLLDWWIRRVSSRARFCSAYFEFICKTCKINMQNMLICKICKICLHLYWFAYCIYFAYEIYIAQLHLIWLEDLLSSGTGGKPKEVYDVSWYSYRKRAIVSGSTESTAYLPNSPALPCRIISHLKAW